MKVTVIIPTRNRIGDLSECLGSVRLQSLVPSETIVVDQSDSEQRNDVSNLCTKFGVKCISLSSQNSSAQSRNVGIDSCDEKAGSILFLDDDVILEKDYIRNSCSFLRENSSAGGTTGVITNIYPSGILSVSARTLFKFIKCLFLYDTPSLLGYEITRTFENSSTILCPRKPSRIKTLSGCNMCVRTQLAKETRFDERLRGYSFKEDVDFSYRIGKRSSLWILPSARLRHKKSFHGRVPTSELYRMMEVYSYYLFTKNMGRSYLSKVAYAYSRIGRLLAIGSKFKLADIIRGIQAFVYVARMQRNIEAAMTDDFQQSSTIT